jgi:hypothetical protein
MIELGPRRFRYAAHSWHQYVHVVDGFERQTAVPTAAAMAARLACDDSLWLQRQYGFGFRVHARPPQRATHTHDYAGVEGCEACRVAHNILRAPLTVRNGTRAAYWP